MAAVAFEDQQRLLILGQVDVDWVEKPADDKLRGLVRADQPHLSREIVDREKAFTNKALAACMDK